MHSRGVAGGKIINTHELTEKRQGRFQYTIGPYSDPVLQVKPGDRVVAVGQLKLQSGAAVVVSSDPPPPIPANPPRY